MKSRVTTAQGDQGKTRTLSGEWHSKSSVILECTGCVDSLRASLAELRLLILKFDHQEREELAASLFWLLHVCFVIGTEVNDPACAHPEYRRENVGEKHLKRIEEEQSRLEKRVSFPSSFIVSASNLVSARCDVCSTVARTLERRVVALSEIEPRFNTQHLLPFVNRLSDYLYVLARHLENGHHIAVDYGVLDAQ